MVLMPQLLRPGAIPRLLARFSRASDSTLSLPWLSNRPLRSCVSQVKQALRFKIESLQSYARNAPPSARRWSLSRRSGRGGGTARRSAAGGPNPREQIRDALPRDSSALARSVRNGGGGDGEVGGRRRVPVLPDELPRALENNVERRGGIPLEKLETERKVTLQHTLSLQRDHGDCEKEEEAFRTSEALRIGEERVP